jgi:hypothetical protein
LRNLAPTPLSSQEAAAVEQDATAAEQDATAAEQDATAAEQDATAAEQDANAVEQDANAAEAPAESPLPVSAVDWRRIEIFREKLQQEAMETCSRCNERWFQMHLATQGDDIGVCKACVRDAKSLKYPSEPFLFGDANNMDPGAVPEHLPTLTEVEEMIIARVHVHLQVARVRGQQYRYTGHVVCFGQNTPKTWKQLPLLPAELDILIVRPAAGEGNHQLHRRFHKRFTVRRSAIESWLRFLKNNHPGYADVEIVEQRL